jgi:hypothetical protein
MNDFDLHSLTAISLMWLIFIFQLFWFYFQVNLFIYLKTQFSNNAPKNNLLDRFCLSSIVIAISDIIFVSVFSLLT